MNFLIVSFLFSIPIAICIFNYYKTKPIPIHITKPFFTHCLFLFFSTILVINYHINYLGIISYISSSYFVLFCVCNNLFTSEEKNKIYRTIRKLILKKWKILTNIILLKFFQFVLDCSSLIVIVHGYNKFNFLIKKKTQTKLYVANILLSSISFLCFYNNTNINMIFTHICFFSSFIILFMLLK